MDRKEIIEKLKFKYDYRFHTTTGFGEESLFYKVSDLEEDLYEDFLSYIPEHFWEDYLGFIFDEENLREFMKEWKTGKTSSEIRDQFKKENLDIKKSRKKRFKL